MVRAGHGFRLARAIVDLAPGSDVDTEALDENDWVNARLKSVCRHCDS